MIKRPNGGGWESAQATGQRGQALEASRNVRLAHLAPILTPSAARSPRADEDFHGLCLYRPKSEAGAAPNAYTCQLTEPSQPCHWPASQVGKLRQGAVRTMPVARIRARAAWLPSLHSQALHKCLAHLQYSRQAPEDGVHISASQSTEPVGNVSPRAPPQTTASESQGAVPSRTSG